MTYKVCVKAVCLHAKDNKIFQYTRPNGDYVSAEVGRCRVTR